MTRLHFIACFLLTAAAVMAGTSADYTLAPEAVDGGGLRGTSAHYTLSGSMMAGEAGSSASYTVHTGFAGQTSTVLVTTTAEACDSYTWAVTGQTYTQSGTYTAVNGFDVQELVLTITGSTSNTTTATACGSYVWSRNGQTYAQSGTYTMVDGCATHILVLTITASATVNTTDVTACAPFVWGVNQGIYSASGIYTHTAPENCITEVLVLTIIDEVTCRTPVFPDYNLSTPKNQALVIPALRITARASVPNGDTVVLSGLVGGVAGSVTTARGATVVLAGGVITYTPLANDTGPDSFKVLLTGASGGTLEATVAVLVSGAVEAPILNITSTKFVMEGGVVARVELIFRGVPGFFYSIQRSENGLDWIDRQTLQTAADGRIVFVEAAPLPPQAFYRTRFAR